MDSASNRSQQVVKDFQKSALAHSALKKIQRLLNEFEMARLTDRRYAWVGMVIVIVVLTVLGAFYFGRAKIVIGP